MSGRSSTNIFKFDEVKSPPSAAHVEMKAAERKRKAIKLKMVISYFSRPEETKTSSIEKVWCFERTNVERVGNEEMFSMFLFL